MRIFVTGGTGLIGSHVAQRLLREGHTVRALVRPSSHDAFLRSLGVDLWSGDITDRSSLRGAMAGCDALIHAAALVVSRASWEEHDRVNVQGTENLLAAAVEQGVERAVHVSSVAVYGGADVVRRAPVDEMARTDTPLPPGEFYARSKREAEARACRFDRYGLIRVAVVRPAVVYGERDRAFIPRLVSFLDRPVAVTVGLGRGSMPVVYAGNVAGGIVQALTVEDAAGRAYNLANDFPIGQRELFELVARELGRRPILFPVPYALVYGAAWLDEAIRRARGDAAPALSRRRVAFLGGGNPFVSVRAREELGWAPKVDHAEGVRRAIAWHLAR